MYSRERTELQRKACRGKKRKEARDLQTKEQKEPPINRWRKATRARSKLIRRKVNELLTWNRLLLPSETQETFNGGSGSHLARDKALPETLERSSWQWTTGSSRFQEQFKHFCEFSTLEIPPVSLFWDTVNSYPVSVRLHAFSTSLQSDHVQTSITTEKPSRHPSRIAHLSSRWSIAVDICYHTFRTLGESFVTS